MQHSYIDCCRVARFKIKRLVSQPLLGYIRIGLLNTTSMKILFDHPSPFLLAHGGLQVQIERTKAGLESIGIEVQFLRWWDDSQPCDVIHYFERPFPSYVDLAHRKGIKVVF